MAPLSLLPVGIASAIFTVLGIAAIVAALLVLEVRDWRCYPLVLLYPFTRDALEYGAVGSFLLLLVALAWRYRDRTVASAAAVGVAIALKLFLWPLVIWFALTRRFRTAFLAAVAAAGVALASWAVIGFAGLLDYPQLLRAALGSSRRRRPTPRSRSSGLSGSLRGPHRHSSSLPVSRCSASPHAPRESTIRVSETGGHSP